VDNYNATLGKLLKWLQLAIKARKDNITMRKAKSKKAKEDREMLIQRDKKG